jgi:hypothetical protein
VESIANFRELKLMSAMSNGELYRPELFVYVRVPAVQAKSVSIFRKKELFSEKSAEAYEETVETLSQNIETIISSFGSLGLSCRELKREELIQNVYTFLNPKRSSGEPAPSVKTFDELDLEKDVLDEVDWLATQSPREQLVFGDLVLGFEQFTLDGYYHRVVTLKTLPEVTYAGMISEFLRLPFHYDLILSLDVPPQADEMAKLQQKRKMAHSMAVTSGNKASDLESETKLSSTEELIRELLNTGQRIYATQLSVILKAPATSRGCKDTESKCA